MRRRVLVLLTIALSVITFAIAMNSNATASGVDLGITGSTVAGVKTGQTGLELGFAFTVTNHSTTSADIAIAFTVTRATADGSDYICPLIRNKFDINADTPACEPGTLAAGKTDQAAILATPTGSGTVVVRACVSNLAGTHDPVSTNNCKTVSVPIS